MRKGLWIAFAALLAATHGEALFGEGLGLAFASGGGAEGEAGGGHGGAVTPVLATIVCVLFAAKISGDLAVRFGQPEVLGELIIGLILGNMALVGLSDLYFFKHDEAIEVLSELGVVLLLFEVGLETSIDEMRKVGTSAFLAAIIGVVIPFFLGWGVAAYFVPDAHMFVHVFVGATLTATSVGITARVLQELKKINTKEAKTILGAAVIDDVMGLMVLAVVSGMIVSADAGEAMNMAGIAKIVVLAVGFLAGAVVLGQFVTPFCFRIATSLRSHGMLLATSLMFCFGLAYLASLVGLAPIVGAFTAGLILEPVHYKDLATREEKTIEELIHPLTGLMLPIFFVLMGAKVDLSVFGDSSIAGFAIALTIAAIIGKQACGLGVIQKGMDRTLIGLGMIPRGEVGLIFVGIGATLTLEGKPVVDSATFGAVVIMVIITTMVTPPLLKWRFAQWPESREES